MLEPQFVCGAYDVSPEHPSDWVIRPLHGTSEKVSLDGTSLKDIAWRKYEYVLIWDAMSVDDYDDLEELFNHHADEGTDITFTYGKWPQSASGVTVVGKMSDRARAGGSGNTLYYSKVVITLTELASRT